MEHTLHFSASTNVKNLFGRGLVTDQIAAVFELVKNSYDADANEVEIIFSNLNSEDASISIIDNGTGMDLQDIENRWMIIGTDSKKGKLYSPIYNRPLNGDKGIGRFSVDRLGSYLHMETQKTGKRERYVLDFDWTLFDEESKQLEEINIPYEEQAGQTDKNGVALCIYGLHDGWDITKLKNLYRNLRQFKSPFTQEDNFRIFITALELGFDRKEVTIDRLEDISSLWVYSEISEKDPETIHIVVNRDGIEYLSTQSNPYKIGSLKAKVLMFNQGDKVRFANRYGIRVREYGNIRLYRDNFRVYPYGEANNDWLDIDRRQAQGVMRFLGTRDIIGYVQIGKATNPELKPLTNRQGLEENDAFENLRRFVIDACIKTIESYYFTKIKRGKNETVKKTSVEINGAIAGLKQLAKAMKAVYPDASKQISEYSNVIKKQHDNQLQYISEQKEIVKVYSRIAQKETFLQKLIHQAMIKVQTGEVALESFIESNQSMGVEDKKQLAKIHDYLDQAFALLRTVRNDVVKKREKRQYNLERLTRVFIDENSAYFSENKVNVELVVKGDMNYVVDESDITTILSNLATNAVKSLKRVFDRKRELRFELYKTERYMIIRCYDNGVGVPEADRERIFDPFQTTTDGFGLGLTIIDEIAREYGGLLELIDTQVGACFSVKMRC